MLDLRFFENPRFSMAAGGVTLLFFTMFGMFFLIAHLIAALERAAERVELRPGLDVAVVADLVAGPMFYKRLVHHERPDEPYASALLDLVLAAVSP